MNREDGLSLNMAGSLIQNMREKDRAFWNNETSHLHLC